MAKSRSRRPRWRRIGGTDDAPTLVRAVPVEPRILGIQARYWWFALGIWYGVLLYRVWLRRQEGDDA